MWSLDDSGEGLSWEEALAWVEEKNTENYRGYSDWRLPNAKELQSIVDYTRSPSARDAANIGPAIDTDFFEVTELASGSTNYTTDYGCLWSSTSACFGPESRVILLRLVCGLWNSG
jgi:hypothetical protein